MDATVAEVVRTLKELLSAAHFSKHNLATEVELCLRRSREGVEHGLRMACEPRRSPNQAQFLMNTVWRQAWRAAELEVLQQTFASCRGEIGAVPVFRDEDAVSEPEIAKWANRLQSEVEEMAWLSVKAQDDAARFRAACAALDGMEGVMKTDNLVEKMMQQDADAAVANQVRLATVGVELTRDESASVGRGSTTRPRVGEEVMPSKQKPKRPYLVEYTSADDWDRPNISSRHGRMKLAEIELRRQCKQLGASQYHWRIRHADDGVLLVLS